MAITPQSKRLALGALALFFLIGLAYRSAPGGDFIWDDDILLSHNENIRSFTGLVRCWTDSSANMDYYPVTYTSWWIENAIWGMKSTRVYHIDNVLLHALNALLLWLILRRLNVSGGWFIAAVWALHPVQVESVAWVAQRKNVLSGLFFFLSAWCFVTSYPIETDADSAPSADAHQGHPIVSSLWLYGLSLLFFVIAMFAKPVTMTLAGILPLLVWWKRGRITRTDIAVLVPYFLLALPMALLTIWVQRHTVRAVGWEFELSLLERCLIAGRVPWFYASKLVWPATLCFAYPKWSINIRDWHEYLYPLATMVAIALLWFSQRKFGRAPLTAVLIFIVALSPALGFISIFWHRYYYVADHVQYLASASLIALAIGLVANYLVRCRSSIRWAGGIIAMVGLAGLTELSANQVPTYRNLETLWTSTLKINPQSWMVTNNLGLLRQQQGRNDDAIVLFRRAIELNPQYAEVHTNLGLSLSHYGQPREKLPEAIAELNMAIKLNPDDGHFHINLGNALAQVGRHEEAIDEFDDAVRLTPKDVGMTASAHYQKAKSLMALKRIDEAVKEFRAAIDLNSDDWAQHYDLACLLAQNGHYREAINEFDHAAQLVPENSMEMIMVLRNLDLAKRLLSQTESSPQTTP